MKKLFPSVLTAFLASALLAAASGGCASPSPRHVHMPNAAETKLQADEQAPVNDNGAKDHAEKFIAVQADQFDPAQLRAKVGDTVTWVNEDSNLHEVHADNDAFAGPPLKFGESFSQKFDGTGEFAYHDHLHEEVKGMIVVE